MDINEKIKRRDSIEDINSKLNFQYKATLFDFAYLLAISLNDSFLPSTGLEEKERSKLKRTLLGTRQKLIKFQYFQDLIEEIEKAIDFLAPEHSRIIEKTKLILLWTQLLIKKHKESCEVSIHEEPVTIAYSAKKINWNDYYTLLVWFYDRLKGFSYSSFIEPKANIHEKSSAKSSLQRVYSHYKRSVHEALCTFQLAQKYFRYEDPISPKNNPLRSQSAELCPLVRVGFFKERIEIGYLRNNGNIWIKEVSFLHDQKKCYYQEEKNADMKSPTVVFQDMAPFVIENYSPPSFPSPERLGQLF
jgi:hypothetical protein